MPLHESIGLANGTSGNAVVFAGTTVIVALLALNITGIPFLGLMGTVGAAAVGVAILVAITLTPAMLSLVGLKILRKKERLAIGHAHTQRVPNTPMKTWRAIVTLVAGVAVLGVIALPAMSMRLGLPVGSSEATSSSQYRAYKTVENKFGAGQNSPLLVVADLPAAATGDDLLRQEIAIGTKITSVGNVAAVAPIGSSTDGTVVAFQVIPKGGPSSVSTEALVNDLRNMSPISSDSGKIALGVAGNASANIDVSEKLSAALPLYLVVVVGLSLLILILVFRSILVPITATAGFVLSLLATFGGITAIYQFGWLSSVFGVHDPAPILSFLPVIEVGVLFGLAMDYQLFLVSGMREAYAHGASAKVAVQRGLHAGRAVVTAAAIIMISVFSGFIFSESSVIRPIGFGLAFGVLLDAFIVRMMLIPAAMHLLGKAAWWLPKWLDRIIPDVDVEGAKLERTHPISHETEIVDPAVGDTSRHGRHSAAGVSPGA
jgi:RND superfamily putative drug exporter